jgi:hypothetical protein
MKQSSKKILSSLWFSPQDSVVVFSTVALQQLVPELSQSGCRSLLTHLQTKGLIAAGRLGDTRGWYLLEAGRAALSEHFPLFKDLPDIWWIVICRTPPEGDREFRFLRQQLLGHYALPLSRGVYALWGEIPPSITELLRSSYSRSVFVASLNDVSYGDFRFECEEYFHTSDVLRAYSSVSSQAARLISEISSKNRLTEGQKKEIVNIYWQWYSAVESDPGNSSRLFTQAVSGRVALGQWQQLFGRLDTFRE